MIKYRAQVKSNDGSVWVDGNLYMRRDRAEADALRLADRYGNEARVIEDAAAYPWDED